jgi:uncharacterized metal-binding protein YceD (DUF177 family)
MKSLKKFTIQFVGLKDGSHRFDYQIDKGFFEFFEYDNFNEVDVHVGLDFEKKQHMLELKFHAQGKVNVNCDVSYEAFDQPIDNSLSLVMKFGEEFQIIDEELIILPQGDFEIEVQQFIYESIVLGVPLKCVHPKVEDGTMDSAILDKLEQLSPENQEKNKDKEETDPRWDKLKELLNDN